jgi:truncated hemoglobin YjbI
MHRVQDLIDEEHRLRSRLQDGEITAEEEQQRLRTMEETLDQCWDLLRQRRALRQAGEDPGQAKVRPVTEVEGYQQ